MFKKIKDKLEYQLYLIRHSADPLTTLSLLLRLFIYLFSFKKIHRTPFRLKSRYQGLIFNCGLDFQTYTLSLPIHEPKTRKIIIESINNIGVFIDVGAHIGEYSILLSFLNPKMKTVAIEPDPINYKLLVENIKENSVKNIIPINKACYKRKTTLLFYHSIIKTGGSSILEEHIHERKLVRIKVKADTLDNIFSKLKLSKNKNILVKIDVEGAELDVLKGAKKLLKKRRVIIIFEAWNKQKLVSIKNYLSKYGFRIKKIGDIYNYIAFKD